jgi:nanoRNase/pAp phosphatase (c-di-AMP/oligoRNAs hydrolase)
MNKARIDDLPATKSVRSPSGWSSALGCETTVLSHPSTQSFFVFDRSNQAANANERLIAIDAPIQTIPSSIDIDHHSINNKCAAQND